MTFLPGEICNFLHVYILLTSNIFRVLFYLNLFTYCFGQAMEGSYIELAEQLEGMGVKVGKFRADGDHKEFAKQKLQLVSFPTILFFPKHSSKPVRYPSEKRDVDSLMAFVNALR